MRTLKELNGYYNDGTYEGLSMAVRWWLSNKRDELLKENSDIQALVLKEPDSLEAWQGRYKFNGNSVKITFLDELLKESSVANEKSKKEQP